jgi:HK97 family phage portal protein
MGRLRSWLRGEDVVGDETRALEPDRDLREGYQLPLRAAYTGTTVTPTQAMGIGDVFAAVRVLSDSASSLPLHVYRKRDDGARERVTSGKLVDLLDRPAPGTTQADLVATAMAHLAIFGSCYLGKYRRAGEIIELSPLHPETIRPELEDGQLRFRYSPGTGPQQMLTESDVTWIKSMSLDGMSGTSPVLNAARVLSLSEELVKHALSYFTVSDAGGVPRPAGVLKVNPGMAETGRQRELEGLRAESRAHGILVASGEIDFIDIAGTLDDAQFTEQRRLVAQEVARCFRIPPHMIGAEVGSSLTYSTTEQQSLDFVKYSLMPWLRRIELAVSGDSDLAFAKQFVRFEVDGLLRADTKTRAEVYHLALDPVQGWMDRSEVRRLEDLPPEAPKPPLQQQSIEQMLRPQGVAANGDRQET